jgi:hypothetical protein
MISTLTAMRVLFSLGIVNLVSALLVSFTCRCAGGSWLGKYLMKYRWYQGFYKLHCYIWWIFWASVVVHAIFAIIYLGWPS